MGKEDQIMQRLREDLQEAEDAAALLPLVAALDSWEAVQATPDETEKLLARLRPLLYPTSPAPPQPLRTRIQWLYWLLQAQFRVVRREIWLGSTFVMALGVIVTLAINRSALPFVLIAPIVAAVGITFLYGPENDPALELELATAVSPRHILLARMTLLFGINFGLGFLGSIVIALLRPNILLLPLLTTWLAPMAFLSALAFFLSIVSFEPLLGVMVSMILWGLQSLHQLNIGLPSPRYIPNLLDSGWQPWLWLLALLLGSTAVFLAGLEERMVGRRAG